MTKIATIPDDFISTKIYFIRDKKVMLDNDLSELYLVETKRLNEQVKRNIKRFPEDFMFQLTIEEWENLIRKMRPQDVRHKFRIDARLHRTKKITIHKKRPSLFVIL
jgi:hypothetical protein